MYINILTRELPDLHPPAQTLNTQISKFNNLWPFPVAYFINTAKCKGPIWNFFFFFFFLQIEDSLTHEENDFLIDPSESSLLLSCVRPYLRLTWFIFTISCLFPILEIPEFNFSLNEVSTSLLHPQR